MLFNRIRFILFLIVINVNFIYGQQPSDFVNLSECIPSLVVSLRYGTSKNFLGRVVKGYENPKPLGTSAMAEALQFVQKKLKKRNIGLILYDSYRPQKAVADFLEWASDSSDTIMKRYFYPDHKKEQLFKLGFIASKSGHSRGSTVDVGLVEWKGDSYTVIDMGSAWDYFGPEAATGYNNLTKQQLENRALLQNCMELCGFKPYEKEWWHFTLKSEPYPNTYFNFSMHP